MKNIVIFLVTCLACVQSTTYAATSPLTESLFEYETIVSSLDDPNFQGIISETEFIVDIVRKTRRLDVTGTVKYFIETCTVNSENKCRKSRTYLATLDVQLNPGVGPRIVTLVDLQRWNSNGKNKSLKNRKRPQKVEVLPENGVPEHPAPFQHITPFQDPAPNSNNPAPLQAQNPQEDEELRKFLAEDDDLLDDEI